MERVIPRTIGDDIQLYMRTYYSLLRSSHAFQIETLVESHIAMQSSLHVGAGEFAPDVGALLYSALRLPPCIDRVSAVLIGQMEKAFVLAGYTQINTWERVFSPGRRRRMQYDGEQTLAVYIASRSDIDDLLPILTAYQIEWNKLHTLLKKGDTMAFLQAQATRITPITVDECGFLAQQLQMSVKDLQRLAIVWERDFWGRLGRIATNRKEFSVRMVNGSLADYRRATATWWEELRESALNEGIDVEQRPIYFVSSNTHSLVNLLTGFATRYEQNLIAHIKQQNQDALLAEYETIQASLNKNLENFLYYVLGKYLSQADAKEQLRQEERRVGIYRVPNKHGFEIEAQVIDLGKLHTEWFDSRLPNIGASRLRHSQAIILNIDYPLGMAAYEILSRITERNDYLQGVYVMGKAATLNARVGDVMLPNVIHDEHSQNTYLINNCFTANHVKPYMTYGNVLDNQKAITALGTFLQNPHYMSVFYREGYTDIEMEGGPYLSAVYEAFRPKRHPENEIVNLYGVPFDVGFLHYASDAPMKHGQNLGAGSLAFAGVESTYATSIAILRRIFEKELLKTRESVSEF
jgi:hypothetical protein